MASLRRFFWWSATYNFRLLCTYFPGTSNTSANAARRLHEAGEARATSLSQPCSNHLFPSPFRLPPRYPQNLETSIDRNIQVNWGVAYAPGTQATYRCHRHAYLKFCSGLGYSPIPATPELIQRYAPSSLKSTSIKQYLNTIRLMHLEWGLDPPPPPTGVQPTMRGIRRALREAERKKLPITSCLLHQILSHLNMCYFCEANVWAVCLVLFFGLLCKVSVLPASHAGFSPPPPPSPPPVQE